MVISKQIDESEREEINAGEVTCQVLELLLFSVGGISQPKIMKMMGKVKGVLVVVMVDSGASHNFISKRLVEKLNLNVENTSSFAVCLRNGVKEHS